MSGSVLVDVAAVLDRIGQYQHEVAVSTADPVQVGPFTSYDTTWGWSYAARPRPGHEHLLDAAALRAVFRHQQDLPGAAGVQWIEAHAPTLADLADSLGLGVARSRLLAYDRDRAARLPTPAGTDPAVTVRFVDPDEPGFDESRAAVAAGFDGTDRGDGEPVVETMRAYVRAGLTRAAGAWASDGTAVGGGTHAVRGATSEVTGVAVLPSWRRRGIAAVLTDLLVRDAREHGAETVFLSAESEQVARIYERVGFRQVGVLCTATDLG